MESQGFVKVEHTIRKKYQDLSFKFYLPNLVASSYHYGIIKWQFK